MISYIKALGLLKTNKLKFNQRIFYQKILLIEFQQKMFIQQIIFLQQIILPLMDMLLII